MRICFLGTGGSWPTKRRNPLSVSVSFRGTNILLDCGEGTQRQMLSTPISPIKLDAVLITHLHGDHFLGLPGLIQTMSLNDREKELRIFGPKGVFEALGKGLTMCHFSPGFKITVSRVKPDDGFTVGDLNVKVGKADHKLPALTYRVFESPRKGRFNKERAVELGIPEGKLWGKLQSGKEITLGSGADKKVIKPEMVMGPPRKGLSMAYTGDTYSTSDVVDIAKGVDLLVHEATFSDELEEKAAHYRHSTASQAASTALQAKVRKLYLVHSSPRFTKEGREDILLREAREIFRESYLPEDLDCVEITR